MPERTSLAERCDEQRTHLRSVAYRMFGAFSEVNDAVHQSW